MRGQTTRQPLYFLIVHLPTPLKVGSGGTRQKPPLPATYRDNCLIQAANSSSLRPPVLTTGTNTLFLPKVSRLLVRLQLPYYNPDFWLYAAAVIITLPALR